MLRFGIDTNVVIRYLLDDDVEQSAQAAHIINEVCGVDNIGYITFAVFFEICWVLLESKKVKVSQEQFTVSIEKLLNYRYLEFENKDVIRRALYELDKVAVDMSDLLIGLINSEKGCTTTVTFDKKAFSRLLEFTDASHHSG